MPKKQICGNQWMSLWETNAGPFIKMGDGVIIVPVNEDNEVLMITEPSIAYDGLRFLGLPAGGIEEDENPAECANRELQEELGFKAGRLESPGTIYAAVRYIEAKFHIFVARDLVESSIEGDEPEGWIQKTDSIALSDLETLIAEGRLVDSLTISALFMARGLIEKEASQQ